MRPACCVPFRFHNDGFVFLTVHSRRQAMLRPGRPGRRPVGPVTFPLRFACCRTPYSYTRNRTPHGSRTSAAGLRHIALPRRRKNAMMASAQSRVEPQQQRLAEDDAAIPTRQPQGSSSGSPSRDRRSNSGNNKSRSGSARRPDSSAERPLAERTGGQITTPTEYEVRIPTAVEVGFASVGYVEVVESVILVHSYKCARACSSPTGTNSCFLRKKNVRGFDSRHQHFSFLHDTSKYYYTDPVVIGSCRRSRTIL